MNAPAIYFGEWSSRADIVSGCQGYDKVSAETIERDLMPKVRQVGALIHVVVALERIAAALEIIAKKLPDARQGIR